MTVEARAVVAHGTDSYRTGREAAADICDSLSGPPEVVVTYLTLNHDAKQFLSGMREVVGPDVPVIGCSSQGVIGRDFFGEDGYIAGAIGLGGNSMRAAVSHVEDIAVDTYEKGRSLGKNLLAQTTETPKVALVHYDPLCGADMDPFLAGVYEVLDCPVVGGGASHPWGPLHETYQYIGDTVMRASAVACILTGDFVVESAISQGTSPVGIEMTVTASEANVVRELDGAAAVDVWTEVAGSATQTGGDQTAALAVGVPFVEDGELVGYLVRAAMGFDPDGGAVLQSGIPEGTEVMLHHRTIDDALEGTVAMGRDLAHRLEGKTVRAVFGFECGGRTKPFLGVDTCRRENAELQQVIGPDAEWIGLLPWGEIHPVGKQPAFNNFTFPMLVIAE